MIVGFRDGWLRAFFADDAHSRNIPSDLEAGCSESSR
jgi:proteic killer suppression protein